MTSVQFATPIAEIWWSDSRRSCRSLWRKAVIPFAHPDIDDALARGDPLPAGHPVIHSLFGGFVSGHSDIDMLFATFLVVSMYSAHRLYPPSLFSMWVCVCEAVLRLRLTTMRSLPLPSPFICNVDVIIKIKILTLFLLSLYFLLPQLNATENYQ
jgi:hypothetical protein